MAVAGSLVATASARIEDFERGMRKMRTELNQLKQASESTSTGFAGLGRSVTTLSAGIISIDLARRAIEGLVSAGTQIVRTGLDMERLRASFTAITGSAQRGREEFQFVSQTANRLGLDVKTLADSYRSLTAATRGTQLAGEDTRALFISVTEASRAYGLSTEQTGRALTALEQIISKGKVSQEELRGQLGEAIPGASQIAARAFGVTTQALDAMIAKGVDAVEFTRRFTLQLQKETPVAADVAGAGFARLGNEIAALKDRIAQSGLLSFLDQASNKLANLLNRSTQADEALRSAALGPLPAGVKLSAEKENELITLFQSIPREGGPGGRAQREASIKKYYDRVRELSGPRVGGEPSLGEEGPGVPGFYQRFGGSDRRRRESEAESRLQKGREILKGYQKDLEQINVNAARTPELFKKHEETVQLTKKRTDELLNLYAGEKDLPREIKTGLDQIASGYTGATAAIEAAAKARRDATKADREADQAEKRRKDFLQAEKDALDAIYASEAAIAYTRAQRLGFDEATAKKIAELVELRQEAVKAKAAFNALADAEAEAEEATLAGFRDRSLRVPKYDELVQREQDKIRDANIALIQFGEREKGFFDQLGQEAEGFGAGFVETISRATRRGKESFRDFTDSILSDLTRALARRFLAPKIDELIASGISLASRIFGGLGRGGGFGGGDRFTTDTLGPLLQPITPYQHGGDFEGPGFLRVGEAGSEIIRVNRGESGHVYPHGQMPGGQTINVYITTPDVQSFQRSGGQLRRAIAQAAQGAARDT